MEKSKRKELTGRQTAVVVVAMAVSFLLCCVDMDAQWGAREWLRLMGAMCIDLGLFVYVASVTYDGGDNDGE